MLTSTAIRISRSAARRWSRSDFNSFGRTAIRNFSPSAVLADDDLPYHIVVGMPALSPTMETGNLSEWYVEEGSGFSAGESIAKIETDKASIDFEAQDDGFVAKILMDAGSEDIQVGVPIMVTVEEEEDIAAFADFVLEEEEEKSVAPEPVGESPPVIEAAPPAPPPPPPTPVEPTTPVVAAVVEEKASVEPPNMEDMAAAVAPVLSTAWGELAKVNSPIHKSLSKQQNAYIEKYGTTGQIPL